MAKERIIVLDVNRRYYDIKEAAVCSMTVAELIEELRYLPEDCKVVFRNDGGYTYGYLKDRFIDSEYWEPEVEEEDVVELEDMIYDIGKACDRREGGIIKLTAIWDEKCGMEFKAVGYNDSRVLGVSVAETDEFVPIEWLSESEVADIWSFIVDR